MKCPICHEPVQYVGGAVVYHVECLESIIPKWYKIRHAEQRKKELKDKLSKAQSFEEMQEIVKELNSLA